MNKLIQKHAVKILFMATLAGVGFSFLGSVLNSKMLSKEAFGDWKYLQNFLVLIAYIVNFGLYSSGGRLIAATQDKIKVRVYKGYMMYFALAGVGVIALTTLIIGAFFPKLLNSNLFHLALVLIPFFLIHPLGFYFESAYQGERKLIALAVSRSLPALLYVGLLYAFKSFSNAANGIYYSALLYYVAYFTVFVSLIISDKPIFKKGTSEFKDLMMQHKSFGIHIYWGALWSLGAIYMLPVLVGLFNINNVEVGHYSLALSFIMPLALLPGIVSTANFKDYVSIPTIPAAAFKKVLLASLALEVGLLLGIDFFIDFFLTSKYKEVSALIKIGSFGAILHGFADFVNKFLIAKGESVYLKKVSIAVGLVQLISSVALIKYFSSTGAIIAKSLGSLVFFAAVYYFYYKNYVVGKSQGKKIKISGENTEAVIPAPGE